MNSSHQHPSQHCYITRRFDVRQCQDESRQRLEEKMNDSAFLISLNVKGKHLSIAIQMRRMNAH